MANTALRRHRVTTAVDVPLIGAAGPSFEVVGAASEIASQPADTALAPGA